MTNMAIKLSDLPTPETPKSPPLLACERCGQRKPEVEFVFIPELTNGDPLLGDGNWALCPECEAVVTDRL